MSNMSYCRFENTSRDLSDCESALDQMVGGDDRRVLSESELEYAKRLANTCVDLLLVLVEDFSNVKPGVVEMLRDLKGSDTLEQALDCMQQEALDCAHDMAISEDDDEDEEAAPDHRDTAAAEGDARYTPKQQRLIDLVLGHRNGEGDNEDCKYGHACCGCAGGACLDETLHALEAEGVDIDAI